MNLIHPSARQNRILTDIIVLLFTALFLYTATAKITDFDLFKEQISTSPVLEPVAPVIAVLVPLVEILTVVLLINPSWRIFGWYGSVGLMILFTGYVIAILLFNKNIPCSCGGVIELLSWNQHIVFNSLFLILGGIGLVLEKRQRNNGPKTAH